jgi:hypothetical protein
MKSKSGYLKIIKQTPSDQQNPKKDTALPLSGMKGDM